jgi:hypothetical protein
MVLGALDAEANRSGPDLAPSSEGCERVAMPLPGKAKVSLPRIVIHPRFKSGPLGFRERRPTPMHMIGARARRAR